MNLPDLLHSSNIKKEPIQIDKKHELIAPQTGMLYMLMSGAVIEVLENPELNKSHINRLLGPGDIFPLYIPQSKQAISKQSDMLLKPYIYYATIPWDVIEFTESDFTQALQTNGDIRELYLEYIGNILKFTEQRLVDQAVLTSEKRIITTLIQLAENEQFTKDFHWQREVKTWLTHTELASLAWLSRQTYTQRIKIFSQLNLLSYNRKRIFIANLEKLKEYLESLS